MINVRLNTTQNHFQLSANFTTPAKNITALYGPSGSGKTTILRAIAGLDYHKNGLIKIGNETWQDEATFVTTHQRNIGYIFQEAQLFPHLSVEQNIRYGYNRTLNANRKIHPDQAIELLNIRNLLPRRTQTLSGGEQQRVAIARALLTSPSLLLMDEPLTGLDHQSKNDILCYLKNLNDRLAIPIIYVSHHVEEITQLAQYIILLENGRTIASGKLQETLCSLDLPLSHDLHATSVIEAEVSQIDNTYHVAKLVFSGGTIIIPAQDLSIQDRVRIRTEARDVSIDLNKASNSSILNILPATIEEIKEVSTSQVILKLSLGNEFMLSRITTLSANKLDLSVGKKVFAQIKCVSLLTK